MSADEVKRLPGESVVSFYNRRLRAKGDYSKEWFIDRMDRLRLRSTDPARRYDLGDAE